MSNNTIWIIQSSRPRICRPLDEMEIASVKLYDALNYQSKCSDDDDLSTSLATSLVKLCQTAIDNITCGDKESAMLWVRTFRDRIFQIDDSNIDDISINNISIKNIDDITHDSLYSTTNGVRHVHRSTAA